MPQDSSNMTERKEMVRRYVGGALDELTG